jgi:hypothetical protein
MEGSCELVGGPLGSIKCAEFLDFLSNCQLLKDFIGYIVTMIPMVIIVTAISVIAPASLPLHKFLTSSHSYC